MRHETPTAGSRFAEGTLVFVSERLVAVSKNLCRLLARFNSPMLSCERMEGSQCVEIRSWKRRNLLNHEERRWAKQTN